MKTKNVIIWVLAILLAGTLIWCYTSDKKDIDNKIVHIDKNVKAESSASITSMDQKANTNYALGEAKLALLKSKVALEIDKSNQKTKAELDNAKIYLSEAKSTADEKTKTEIDNLKTKVETAKMSIVQNKEDALSQVSAVADDVKTVSEKYNDKFQSEKKDDLAAVNKKYADLRAEEALFKAKIAAQSEKTYAQSKTYLEEANEWVVRSKEYGSREASAYNEQMQKDIKEAQSYLNKKDKEARNKIAHIFQKASEQIKAD